MLLFLHAYSLGGGTYTGIEAVSNGLPIMREPRVQTGKRTMVYMAASLAFTAGGLLLCYLLWRVSAVAGKTMNAVLVETLVAGIPFGGAFVSPRSSPKAACWSSPPRPASSTDRGCSPTWRSTPGCRTASPRSPSA